MGKRQPFLMGIAAVSLPLFLGACSVNLDSSETSYTDKVPNPKPYTCTEGDWDGPGVIQGQKLKSTGRLSQSTVFMIHKISAGSDNASLCTGTLVSRDIILTAAHCVDGGLESTRAERLVVIFGNDPLCALSKKDVSKVRKAEKIIIHPEWSSGRAGGVDLALVKLETAAPWTSEAMGVAVDLPSLDDDREIFGAGYGKTTDYDEEDGDLPYLRIAKLKPQNKVPNQGIMNNPASKKLIFTQKEGGGSLCKGDSGGPAVVVDGGQVKVVGVASYVWDPTASTCKSYVVHTSVAFYRDWLSETYDKLIGYKSYSNPFKR